jgi:uncharacterized protein involved in exopolysaccharide biosynthesis
MTLTLDPIAVRPTATPSRGRRWRLPFDAAGRRCLVGALACAGLAWGAAAAYLTLMPPTYVSRWTLIIPGAGQSATVHLESIGQTTTSVESPYSSVSLSPRVVYKEIVNSETVRADAAARARVAPAAFGRAKIKLVDETSLIMMEITGASPGDAQDKATALLAAFDAQVERLRRDELAKRSAAVTANLDAYRTQLEAARRRITEVQVESGLVSTGQFDEQVAALGASRRRRADLAGEVDRLRQEQARLAARLGIAPGEASVALRLASDPAWSRIVAEYAEAHGDHLAQSTRLGPANPVRIALAARMEAARGQLRALMDRLGFDIDATRTLLLVTDVSRQADLFQQLVRNEAQADGKSTELVTLTAEVARLEAEVTRLAGPAARLDGLRKQQIRAEAVYASAIARLDTSQSDVHGVYPIVQVVEPPTLPDGHEQPRTIYAVAGGAAGTLFCLLGWGMVWLHFYQRERRRKRRSSSS